MVAAETSIEISVRGKWVRMPAFNIEGTTLVASGKWLKFTAIKGEEWQGSEGMLPPDQLVEHVRRCRPFGADIFTFSQRPNDSKPRFPYYYELDSVAVVPITTYEEWWTERLGFRARQDVKRAAKQGVVVRIVPFDDELVRGIMGVYNDNPIRQGGKFYHYNRSFEDVKRAHATYLETSEFIGAFLGDELLGYVKIVYGDNVARLMQITSKVSHQDKRPTNALLAKAVEVSAARGCSHLTYGKYHYAQGADSLTAFKHRTGFEEILVPRYYIPLTITGKLALNLGLHRGIKAMLPGPVLQFLKRVRTSAYRLRERISLSPRSSA
jgi:hypothetical protein